MSDKEDSKPLKVLPLVDEKPHKNALKKKLNPITIMFLALCPKNKKRIIVMIEKEIEEEIQKI